jgi:hypothetical protein
MDKFKHYLGLAGKHHFWILCGLIALITVGSWYTTSAKLKAEFKAQETKIKGAENELNTIMGVQNHPNDEYKLKMEELTNNYKAQLRELWAKQYQEQGVNLQWPQEVLKDGLVVKPGLTEEFVFLVKDLRPIELKVPFDPKAPELLKGGLREQYRDFVKVVELPRLAKIIGAIWHPSEMNTGNRNFGGTDNAPESIVEWHAENQEFLQNTRFDWSKEPSKRPSTLQILYAQEDLWILETLINIIAKTNQDADARHNAVVKEIKYLKLGADAVGLSGQVTPLVSTTATPGPGQPGQPGYPTPGATPPPMVPQPGPGANIVIIKDPAEGRYVDEKYQPVPPGRLRDAFKSTAKPEEAFLAVAKRVPVRMHLVVDQRYINRLLAECGNSNLIVEIRQVRVNRPIYEGGSSTIPGAPRGYPAAGGGERGFQPAFDPGRSNPRPTGPRSDPGRGGPRGGGETPEEERSRHEIDMELYGLVYIYNPVNEAMVTVAGSDASGLPPPGTTTSITPPATTPPATTPPATTPPATTPPATTPPATTPPATTPPATTPPATTPPATPPATTPPATPPATTPPATP